MPLLTKVRRLARAEVDTVATRKTIRTGASMDIEVETSPAAALHEALARIGGRSTAGFRRDVAPGVTAYATGTPMRSMNGVTADARLWENPADAVQMAVGAMRETSAPWTVQAYGPARAIADALPETAFTVLDTAKTWVVELERVPDVPAAQGLTITPVTDETDRVDFADVLGRAFGAGQELGLPLVEESILTDPGIIAYLGRKNGVPLVTGMAVFDGAWTGVFAIATESEHRRSGLGAAMMSRIVRDGLDHGTRAAYLQASALGLPLYRRLGFADAQDDTTYLTVRS